MTALPLQGELGGGLLYGFCSIQQSVRQTQGVANKLEPEEKFAIPRGNNLFLEGQILFSDVEYIFSDAKHAFSDAEQRLPLGEKKVESGDWD